MRYSAFQDYQGWRNVQEKSVCFQRYLVYCPASFPNGHKGTILVILVQNDALLRIFSQAAFRFSTHYWHMHPLHASLPHNRANYPYPHSSAGSSYKWARMLAASPY